MAYILQPHFENNCSNSKKSLTHRSDLTQGATTAACLPHRGKACCQNMALRGFEMVQSLIQKLGAGQTALVQGADTLEGNLVVLRGNAMCNGE